MKKYRLNELSVDVQEYVFDKYIVDEYNAVKNGHIYTPDGAIPIKEAGEEYCSYENATNVAYFSKEGEFIEGMLLDGTTPLEWENDDEIF